MVSFECFISSSFLLFFFFLTDVFECFGNLCNLCSSACLFAITLKLYCCSNTEGERYCRLWKPVNFFLTHCKTIGQYNFNVLFLGVAIIRYFENKVRTGHT